MAFVPRKREESPNDPKLRDSGVRRGSCAAGLRGAATVTHGAVLCSAWLGVAVIAVSVVRSRKIPKLGANGNVSLGDWRRQKDGRERNRWATRNHL